MLNALNRKICAGCLSRPESIEERRTVRDSTMASSDIRLELLACSTTHMVSNDELVAGQPRSYARCSPMVVARTP